MRKLLLSVFSVFLLCSSFTCLGIGQKSAPKFKVIAFYTAKNDQAHISFVHEANRWFTQMASKYNFIYDSTDDWNNMNTLFLAKYQVVIFLDTRPDQALQRETFREFMENGGAWLGFHFSAFALTPSDFPQDWDWYHNQFLGSGEYKGNTWRPASAVLRVENHNNPSTRNLPDTFIAIKSSPSRSTIRSRINWLLMLCSISGE